MATPSGPDVGRMTRGARRAFLVLAAALLAVMAASPAFTVTYANSTAHRQDVQARKQDATITRLNATIAQLRMQQLAACAFAADLGNAPLPAVPRPSRLGVSIIADSRAWWHRNDCPGMLLPPSPGLVTWGRLYHVPVS